MRFPPAPTSLRGIRVWTSGIEPGGHCWVKNPTKALLGGLEMPSERGSVWQFLFLPGNLLPGQLKEVFFISVLELRSDFWDLSLWAWNAASPRIFASVRELVVLDEFLLKCLGLNV